MLKIALLITSSFLLFGCDDWPVEPPEYFQCQFNWTNERPMGAWYCKHTETKEFEIRDVLDNRMKGAQAVSADDYVLIQSWLTEIYKWINEQDLVSE